MFILHNSVVYIVLNIEHLRKRKEQEEREHQIREQILQQRKQKVEEVTEKFQRSIFLFHSGREQVP